MARVVQDFSIAFASKDALTLESSLLVYPSEREYLEQLLTRARPELRIYLQQPTADMSLTSRGVRAAARSLRPAPRLVSRQYASHGGDHGDDQGHHGESAHHVADGPASEGFGVSTMSFV